MATMLETYNLKKEELNSKLKDGHLYSNDLLLLEELIYRISVLETFRAICNTAPITSETEVIKKHFRITDSYINFVISERRFKPQTPDIQKKQETAIPSLNRVVMNYQKQFTSFKAQTEDYYKISIQKCINSILLVWVEYRNTFIDLYKGVIS